MRSSHIDYSLLDRYATGECTPQEVERVKALLNEDKEVARGLDAILLAIRKPAAGLKPVEESWAAFEKRMTEKAPARRAGSGMISIWPSDRWVKSANAGILVLCACTIVLVWYSVPGISEYFSRPQHTDVAAVSHTTARGERARVVLGDGTQVELAAESRLTFAQNFGRGSRDVYLNGEAVFTVSRNTESPFIVHAGSASARVIGTRFGVRAYPAESKVRVVVTDGRISLKANPALSASEAILAQGDMGEVNAEGQSTVVPGVDVSRYLSWTNGTLSFTRAPLSEVVSELERWYDLNITLANPDMASMRLTVDLKQGSAEEAISILAQVLDLEVTQNGKEITLKERVLK